MRFDLFAFYAGPDQIMGVASGLATIVGVLLMFWNKVLVTFGKIKNRLRPVTDLPEAHEDPQ